MKNCNEKVMANCYYANKISGHLFCDYLSKVGHSRGCKPSECDKYRSRKRPRKDGARG